MNAYLGRDNEIVTLPTVLLDGLAHKLLALPIGITLSAIDEITAHVVHRLHASKSAFCVRSVSIPFQMSWGGQGEANWRLTSVDIAAVCKPAAQEDGPRHSDRSGQECGIPSRGDPRLRLQHCAGRGCFVVGKCECWRGLLWI
jgi:hypothetical protein